MTVPFLTLYWSTIMTRKLSKTSARCQRADPILPSVWSSPITTPSGASSGDLKSASSIFCCNISFNQIFNHLGKIYIKAKTTLFRFIYLVYGFGKFTFSRVA